MAWNLDFVSLIAQAQPAADAAEGGLSLVLRLVIAIAVIVGSFGLGAVIARALRMPDDGLRIGLVLFTLIASLVVNFVGWPPKRGIDLSGGVVLVYEVDQGLSKPSWMPTALARLNEALNADGGEKLEARPGPNETIEVVVPKGIDTGRVDRAIAALRNADITLQSRGKRTEDDRTVLVYAPDQQQQRVDMDKLIAAVGRRINPSGVKELTIRRYGAEQLEVIIPEVEEREVDQIKRRISTSGLLEFRIVANENDHKDIIKAALKTPGRDVYIGSRLVGRWVQAGQDLDVRGAITRQTEGRGTEILVALDPFDVDGRYLSRAAPGFDQGRMAVNFSFDAEGAKKFGQLTSKNLPDPATGLHRRLGIILDNVMLSAPQINSAIYGDGQITGNFTQEEVDFLVGVLNAGSLPATLRPEPISQQRISSQLGDDTIRKGSLAMIISTVAILIFMAIYYRFCGIVADIAVVLNMIVTVALMILIKAAFTLPGLAGLVLTVGMAVDANVLIYERMREELHRGASLRMAIRNGFSRAMATIIDSHVTTLSTGVVLYIVGTDQIKGFAVTLILGLMMSLYTAVFVARVFFDVFERKRWLTRLNMMHLIGETHFDFVRFKGPAIAASAVIIAIGLVAAVLRGSELLDIDFTGGSSVQILFAEGKPHDIADVRAAVSDLPDVAVSSVGEGNLEFKVDTSDHDIKHVQTYLQEKFGDNLRTYAMNFGEITKIEDEMPKESSAEAAEPPVTEAPSAAPSEKKEEPKPEEKPAAPTSEPAPPAEKTEQTKTEQPKAEEPKTEQPKVEEPKSESKPADEKAKPDETNKSSRLAPRALGVQLASVGNEAALAALALAQDSGQPAKEEAAPAKSAPETATPAEATPQAAPADAAATESQPVDQVQSSSMVGGSRATLTFPQEISYSPVRELIDKHLAQMDLKNVIFELRNPKYQPGSDKPYKEWTLEIQLPSDQTAKLLESVKKDLSSTPVFPSSNQIGGKVAGDTQLMALYAMLASMVMIVIYVWVRFQNVIFGLAAVLALIHDVLVAIAFLALSAYLSPYLGFLLVDPFKINLSVMAALLTIVGFSINDTIVVFDRIREVRGKSPELTGAMINASVNQTLSRTLLTSGTVFIACIILYIVGGPGIHAFAFAMVVGVIAGTYSSIYIAAPVLLWMRRPTSRQTSSSGAYTSAGSK